MKFVNFLIKFVILSCLLYGYAPNCFGLDREAFSITRYDLNAKIEPEQQRLGVRGKITLRNDSSSAQKNAVLQISSSLSWHSIKAQDKQLQFVAQPYQSDIDHTGALSEAIVSLPKEIAVGDAVELEIGYEGTIVLDTTRLTRIGTPKEIAAHSDWDQIGKSFTAVRGIGYVAWYPVMTESASLSDGNTVFETIGRWKTRSLRSSMDLNLCEIHGADLPAGLEISNGVLAGGGGYGGGAFDGGGPSPERHGATCRDYKFHPIGLTVPLFVLTDYSTLIGKAAIIYHRADHKSDAQAYEQADEKVAPLVTNWFGTSKKGVEIVELPDANDTPYESGTMLLTALAGQTPELAQMSFVHELTHAAFLSRRPWVFEGLAHFLQALYREELTGRQSALDSLGANRDTLLDAEKPPAQPVPAGGKTQPAAPRQLLITTFEPVFYRTKALYVWWMLRDMVGDDALKKALAAYRPEQDKEPFYMQHLIEVQAKRDLGWFFDDWVYQDRGLPDFRVAYVYAHQNAQGGGHLVTITVENLGGAGAQVPVTLRMESGEITKRLEVRGKSTNSLRIEAPSAPVEVVVNDGSVPEMDMANNTFKVETSGK